MAVSSSIISAVNASPSSFDLTSDFATRKPILASKLINTRYFPPMFTQMRLLAHEAQAYHNLRPYPWWQFADWRSEERGPLPRCLPLARRIVKKSAKWLFGKPVQISMPSNEKLEKWYRHMWQLNRMPSRMVAGAELGGYQGGVALKWSYDDTNPVPLSFQILSTVDHCRLYYDPHDSDDLLMARVQYPVWNPDDGEWYLYREEWTDEEEVHYRPVLMSYSNTLRRDGSGRDIVYGTVPVIAGTKEEPDNYEKWEIISREMNEFGIIPLTPIRNVDVGAAFGAGDLWTDAMGGMFRVMDRINLTYHLMDRSNQFDSERNIVLLDVNAGQDQVDKPFQPGQPRSLKSDQAMGGENAKGQILELEASGLMRPHMMDFAQELKREILATVGNVDIRSDEVTNKGNLTQAVLAQLYAPLIESTEEKRKTYGEDGIAKFLERCAVGLKNAGIDVPELKGVNVENEESYDIQLQWSDYFLMGEDEKTTRVNRFNSEVTFGFLNRERATEFVAKTENIEDITVLKGELAPIQAVMDKTQMEMAAMVQETAGQTPGATPTQTPHDAAGKFSPKGA